MSVARGFGLNGKSLYTNVVTPQYVWANFTVTASNGQGVTSLKSNGYVQYVFMHTSTTPTASSNGVTNPNPASGYGVICFKNNFNHFLGMRWSVIAPPTSTTTTSTTANTAYVITALGTATLAQWQAVGLPQGFTPTVGQSFIATASQSIGGSANVGLPGITNVGGVTLLGTPDTLINNSSISPNAGCQLGFLFQDFAGAAVAPTAGSIVSMEFCFDRSSVTIDGL